MDSPSRPEFTHHIRNGEVFNTVGYAENGEVASTGTSKPGKLCMTDAMSVCIGVAIGGVSQSGRRANVRVFHVHSTDSIPSVSNYIQRLKEQGLVHIGAALEGGTIDGDEVNTDEANRLRSLFQQENVRVAFDNACDRRSSQNALGVVIVPADGSGRQRVKFVNHITSDHIPQGNLRLLDE
jgi:hypothetical protein